MVGLLYESDEWSDHKLAAELRACGCPVTMVDMECASALDDALKCDFLVSRVFASAQFRGHGASLSRMERLVREAEARGIPMANPGRAHGFEVDKGRAGEELARRGLRVPEAFACAHPADLDVGNLRYPAVIKPNCGGRTTCTAVVRDASQARSFLKDAPDIPFVAQEYVFPEKGFITRVELVGGVCALVVQRSVGADGLSAYRLGSTYRVYEDCPEVVRVAAQKAGETLSIRHGSFDIIEREGEACFIDANAVSNVSEDCTELFGFDLMRAHAIAIAGEYRAWHASRAAAANGAPTPDDFVHQLSRTLAQANRFLCAALAKRGLSGIAPSHGDILETLFRSKTLSMQDLARAIDRDPSTVTALVKKLAASGYVRMEKQAADRRVTVVSLAEGGRALRGEFAAVSEELRAVQGEGIDPAAFAAVCQTLAAVQGNFRSALVGEKENEREKEVPR